MCFEFRRMDNGKAVLVEFRLRLFPFPKRRKKDSENFYKGLSGMQRSFIRGVSFFLVCDWEA